MMFFVSINIYSQKMDYLPSFMDNSFREQFPTVFSHDWTYDGKVFEFNFFYAGMECNSIFAANGEWINTECIKDVYLLPKKVREYISDKYEACATFDIIKIETPDNPGGYYEFKTECEDKNQLIRVDKEAKVISMKTIASFADDEL